MIFLGLTSRGGRGGVHSVYVSFFSLENHVLVVSIAFDRILATAIAVEDVILQVREGRCRCGSCVFTGVQWNVLSTVFTFVEIT